MIIVGGTPAGIAAAKSDKKVIILEQSSVLDGVLSSVVIRLDDYYLASNSGVIESFRERVRDIPP
jgi:ribulose 1,5-bisphosphate synthetase/thiazole synthase